MKNNLIKEHKNSQNFVFRDEDLPKGWVETGFEQIIKIIPLTGKKLKQNEYQKQGKIPIIDQGKKFIGGYSDNTRFVVDCNLPIIIFGDHTKNVKFIDQKFIAGADGIKVLEPNSELNPKLIYYFIQTIPLPNKGYARHYQHLAKSHIRIPPLQEQHRIVSKLESIFAQIDACKERLLELQGRIQSEHASLNELKNSVLKQAFEGKLVSQNSNGKHSTNKWTITKLENITLFSKNGFTGRPNENNQGIPRLGIETVTNSKSVFINSSKCKFIDVPLHRLDNYLVQKNDLFFCRQNGNKNYVGKCGVFIDDLNKIIFSDSLILFRIDSEKICPDYLAYFVNSKFGRNQIERYCSTTAGNYSVNGTNLKKIEIKFPSITEQQRIVSKIESIFAKIDAKYNRILLRYLQF